MKVATITANHNGGRYFKDSLKSILEQTIKPIYIVVADDKSTDDSVNLIVETFKNAGGRITLQSDSLIEGEINNIRFALVLLPEHKNAAQARNATIKYLENAPIKVDAIQIIDIDDYLYPTKIEESIKVVEKYANVALVYSDYDTYNVKTGIKKREYKEIYDFPRLCQECIVSNNSFVMINIFKSIGYYDEDIWYCEDYDLWVRIGRIAAVYHIPKALYQYNLTGNNVTTTTAMQKQAFNVQKVHRKILEMQHGQH